MHQQQTTFENIVGKGEIACKEQFLLFPQSSQLIQITVYPFVNTFDISLFATELKEPKIDISGKGLRLGSVADIQDQTAEQVQPDLHLMQSWKRRNH